MADRDRRRGRGGVRAPAGKEESVVRVHLVVQQQKREVVQVVPGLQCRSGLALRRCGRPGAADRTLVVPVHDEAGGLGLAADAMRGGQKVRLPVARRVVDQRPAAPELAVDREVPDAAHLVAVGVGLRTRHADVARPVPGRPDDRREEVEEPPVDRGQLKLQLLLQARRHGDLDHRVAARHDRRPELAVGLVVRVRERADRLAAVRRVDPQRTAGRHAVARETEVEGHRAGRRHTQPPHREPAVARDLPDPAAGRRHRDRERLGERQGTAGRFRLDPGWRADHRRSRQHRDLAQGPKPLEDGHVPPAGLALHAGGRQAERYRQRPSRR